MHDYGGNFIDVFSHGLHCLSSARRREIVRVHRMAGCCLLPDPGDACSARIRNFAIGDRHARSGFSSPLGSASAYCSFDAPNLALCLGYGRVYLPYALQMVSAAKSTIAADRLAARNVCSQRSQIGASQGEAAEPRPCLASGKNSMFDQRTRRGQTRNLW